MYLNNFPIYCCRKKCKRIIGILIILKTIVEKTTATYCLLTIFSYIIWQTADFWHVSRSSIYQRLIHSPSFELEKFTCVSRPVRSSEWKDSSSPGIGSKRRRGRERSARWYSEDEENSATTTCNMRDIPLACVPAWVLDCVRDLVVHSPVTSLSSAVPPLLPSFSLALALPAFLPRTSTWFYHAITWTIDHAWRSARSRKRETEMNRGRGKRSRELTTKPTLCPFPYRSCHRHVVWLFWRIVQSVFFSLMCPFTRVKTDFSLSY